MELIQELAPLRPINFGDHPWVDWESAEAHRGQRLPGGQSRWGAGKDLSWEPLRIELLAEVKYAQLIVPAPRLVEEIFR